MALCPVLTAWHQKRGRKWHGVTRLLTFLVLVTWLKDQDVWPIDNEMKMLFSKCTAQWFHTFPGHDCPHSIAHPTLLGFNMVITWLGYLQNQPCTEGGSMQQISMQTLNHRTGLIGKSIHKEWSAVINCDAYCGDLAAVSAKLCALMIFRGKKNAHECSTWWVRRTNCAPATWLTDSDCLVIADLNPQNLHIWRNTSFLE